MVKLTERVEAQGQFCIYCLHMRHCKAKNLISAMLLVQTFSVRWLSDISEFNYLST